MSDIMTIKKEKKESAFFSVLQRVGRAFMLPIALLPIAGLLLGVGSSLTNTTMLQEYNLVSFLGPGTVLYSVFTLLAAVGTIIFDNTSPYISLFLERFTENDTVKDMHQQSAEIFRHA